MPLPPLALQLLEILVKLDLGRMSFECEEAMVFLRLFLTLPSIANADFLEEDLELFSLFKADLTLRFHQG